jgi:hypothetical protein
MRIWASLPRRRPGLNWSKAIKALSLLCLLGFFRENVPAAEPDLGEEKAIPRHLQNGEEYRLPRSNCFATANACSWPAGPTRTARAGPWSRAPERLWWTSRGRSGFPAP